MPYTEIPAESIKIQNGLYAHLESYTTNGLTRQKYSIYSSEGYCFYCRSIPENYDEEGNLKPPHKRIYATYMSCSILDTLQSINEDVVSVLAEDGFEIVSMSSIPYAFV